MEPTPQQLKKVDAIYGTLCLVFAGLSIWCALRHSWWVCIFWACGAMIYIPWPTQQTRRGGIALLIFNLTLAVFSVIALCLASRHP